ncbi:MAG: CapA family protein [Candidatus Jettenia sp.]|nr:CapA family protein [Candidatus Jettenia sp.]
MKFLFTGDVMLGRFVNEILQEELPTHPWGNTLPIFWDADVRICNLECVISNRGNPWTITPKVFHFRSDAKNIEVLKAAGIHIVSLANNHTLDYEYEAMFEMLKILDTAGIRHAGAGINRNEASRPAFLEIGGMKIGFIAFTDNESDWEATEEKPGIFYVPVDTEDNRAKRLFEIIRSTKKEVQVLVISAHWGPNWGNRPQPHHISFGHTLIDAGADIVFGHSCHVFQGIEIYLGKPIIYSAGDFIDDYAVDEIERNDESFIFTVEVRDSQIYMLRLYPTIIYDFQATLAKQIDAKRILLKMQRLCAKFNTSIRNNEEWQYGDILI